MSFEKTISALNHLSTALLFGIMWIRLLQRYSRFMTLNFLFMFIFTFQRSFNIVRIFMRFLSFIFIPPRSCQIHRRGVVRFVRHLWGPFQRTYGRLSHVEVSLMEFISNPLYFSLKWIQLGS